MGWIFRQKERIEAVERSFYNKNIMLTARGENSDIHPDEIWQWNKEKLGTARKQKNLLQTNYIIQESKTVWCLYAHKKFRVKPENYINKTDGTRYLWDD